VNKSFYVGNANDDADQYRGWLLGSFVDTATHSAIRKTDAIEIKWGIHPKGDQRPEWAVDDSQVTILLLVSGRFRLDLTTASITLDTQGDYVVWGPGLNHSWQAEDDSVVITIRWEAAT
jgi:quercetin dioxygenase-like cupin family protein